MFKDYKRTPELDTVQREAVAWVQKLISGDVTPDDAEALKRWRAQSPAHLAAFVSATEAWRGLGPAGHALRERGGEFLIDLAHIARERRMMTRRLFLGGAVATTATAAYLSASPPLGLWPSITEFNADFRTGKGEQRNIKLANDVSIGLNTQTSVAIRRSEGDGDQLELISGEASFSTSPTVRRSLVVLASVGQASTETARFDMRRLAGGDGKGVSVTCFAGLVRVNHQSDIVEIKPSQQVFYNDTGLGRVVSIDPESVSNWQRGIVVFQSTPLAEAVEEINRYRPGRIVLVNSALGQKKISGRFRINEMNEVLTRLEQAFSARIHWLPGGIVLLS